MKERGVTEGGKNEREGAVEQYDQVDVRHAQVQREDMEPEVWVWSPCWPQTKSAWCTKRATPVHELGSHVAGSSCLRFQFNRLHLLITGFQHAGFAWYW